MRQPTRRYLSLYVSNDEQSVFTTALEIESIAERASYVRLACGGDDSMRVRIESLLAAHAVEDGLLDAPLAAEAQDIASAIESPGTAIGRYTIVELLGEGGFGVVYKARQEEPIRRLVALKVTKLGMDTEQIVSRFNSERQALALMDHPNIASVHDAGATDDGRPFFVMELVDGISITEFCDRERLTIRDRLNLFVLVCRAIQHAHEKGVIHRDVKPSNVLVTRKDGIPYPKVIDFGIATAAADDEADLSNGQWAGTPAYMSPEQVVLGKAHVDLRTDVYGLGVLLYELLIGRTPHVCLESDTDVGITEIRRRIEQEDPQSPSEALRNVSTRRAAVLAERRQTDAGHLVTSCRGDLDCIVMKALRRQPRERYDSVLEFARDIERLLRNEPIHARSSNVLYRGRKFLSRHRRPLAGIAGMVTLLTIVAVPLLYSWNSQRVQEAQRLNVNRQKIERALVEADRLHEQALVAGSTDLQKITKAVEAARRAEALVDSAEADDPLQRRIHEYLVRLRKEESDRRFLSTIDRAQIDIVGSEPAEQLENEQTLLEAFEALGIVVGVDDPQTAARVLNESTTEVQGRAVAAIDIWCGLYCQDTPDRRAWLLDLARIVDPHPWRLRLRDAVRRMDRAALESLANDKELGQQSPSCFIVLIQALQQSQSRHALTVLQRATDAYPNVLFFNTVLGNYYSQRARRFDADAAQKAIRYLSAALALRPTEPRILNNLGMNLSRVGDHQRAVRLLQKATQSHPKFWYSWHNLGLAKMRSGDYHAAAEAWTESIKLLPTIADRPDVEKLLKRTLVMLRDARRLGALRSMFDDHTWSFTSERPPDWPAEAVAKLQIPSGVDQWREGETPFGSSYFAPRTPWSDRHIWLHRSFDAAKADDGLPWVLVVRAVARVQVYLDGQRVLDERFTRDEPRCFPLESSQTQQGQHTITVFAISAGNERCVDIDLGPCDLELIDAECHRQWQDTIQWFRDNDDTEDSTVKLIVNALDRANDD